MENEIKCAYASSDRCGSYGPKSAVQCTGVIRWNGGRESYEGIAENKDGLHAYCTIAQLLTRKRNESDRIASLKAGSKIEQEAS